jgi:multimeric flavodoxin WrbA
MNGNTVILSGSPRKGANTDRLTEAFISGMSASGRSFSLFRAADLKVGGCLGCGHCFREPGVCVQKDDMQPVLAALRKAEGLVLASPVYYFGLSGQLKLVIDRFYALLKEGMPVKRAALLLTCGANTDAAANSAISMFRQISAFLKWEEAGIIVAPRLHKIGEIAGRAELELARLLGENF